jgi:hypothetical protein
MLRYALLLIVILAITPGGNALASEIYKWTDAEGNVHYVDRPTGDPTEQRMSVISSRTDSASVRANVQARLERQAGRAEARSQAEEAEKKAADAKAEQEQRQKQCAMYRARMESYLQSQRLYREDASGERVYLDEDEILAARAKVQDKIQETCD